MVPVFGFPDMSGGQLCAQFRSLSAPKVISITRPEIGRVDSTNLLDDPDGSVLGVHSHEAALC